MFGLFKKDPTKKLTSHRGEAGTSPLSPAVG